MKKIYLATNNQNKVKEMKEILAGLPVEVLGIKDLDIDKFEVIEDGETLEENSYKKAAALANYTDEMVVADDSGLFVDALDGQPGVHSSRYAGEDGNDKKNNEKLLEELEGVAEIDRGAKFATVITLIDGEEVIVKRGECTGRIIEEPRGDNGFGYDPLFIPSGFDRTFAELDDTIKNDISHRHHALEKLFVYLEESLKIE